MIVIWFISGCKSTQTLKDNEYLLAKNKLIVKGDAKIDLDEVKDYVQQKPNKTILGVFKFHLFLFNIISNDYVEHRNIKCDERVDRRNERRRLKNIARIEKAQQKGIHKDSVKLKPYIDCHPSFWDNLRNTIGERPVIFDSVKVKKSQEQINLYLKNKGFFNNKIESQIELKPGKKKAFVTYTLIPGIPYTIKKVSYAIDDLALLDAVRQSTNGTLLYPGNNYDVNVIDEERKRLTKAMRDQGYYFFNKDYIVYQIDSNLNSNQVTIKQIIRNPSERKYLENGEDTIVKTQHQRYRISRVVVNTSFDPKNQSGLDDENMIYIDSLYFANKYLMRHQPEVVSNQIFVRQGQYFSQSKDEYTYRRLAGLNNFKFINIRYQEDKSTDSNLLICYINLTPSVSQSTSLEAEGTNSGGQLGMSGSWNYKNKNTFRHAEIFNLRLKAGVEAQQTINGTNSPDGESALQAIIPFNTIEYGAESSIAFPKLLLFEKLFLKKLKNNNPKTKLNLSWNYQQRPEYVRTALNTALSLNFQGGGKNAKDFKITPFQISVIGITKTKSFQDYLDNLNNSFLRNTYEDHYIQSSRFQYTWTNRRPKKTRNFSYYKFDFEAAGNTSQLVSSLYSKIEKNTIHTDSEGREYYKHFNIRFAQFIKTTSDIRHYVSLSSKNQLVYRAYAGIGLPYGNLNVLPFDRSFFGGGANDIRAWNARRLGPGGLLYSQRKGVDQLGEILIEGNIEYRFELTPTFKSALFVDAGNVWLINQDDKRPDGNFDVNRFYKEIAIGAGIGLRFDFGFLLLRLDTGFKLKDPGLISGERWIFQPKSHYSTTNNNQTYNRFSPTFNLGIDYPF